MVGKGTGVSDRRKRVGAWGRGRLVDDWLQGQRLWGRLGRLDALALLVQVTFDCCPGMGWMLLQGAHSQAREVGDVPLGKC